MGDGSPAAPDGGPPGEPSATRPTSGPTRHRGLGTLLAGLAVVAVAALGLGGTALRGLTGPGAPAPSSSPSPAPVSGTPGTPAPGVAPVVVAAVGDSNTFGQGVEPGTESYPAQLQGLLGDGYQVLNFGVRGRSVLSTAQAPYTADPLYAESLRSDADVVLLMLGTNDAKDAGWDPRRFRSELADLVEVYQSLPGEPQVYLLTVPPAFANTAGVPPERVSTEVVPGIRAVAGATGVPLIDVDAALRAHADLFDDGIHPDATGFGIIAGVVHDTLVGG